MRSRVSVAFAFLGLVFSSWVYGGQGKAQYDKMDYGPYLAASILSDPASEFHNDTGNFTIGKNKAYCDITARGIAIRLTDDWNAGVVFDADGCRMSAGWIGGPLKFKGLIGDGGHGPSPTLSHPPVFQVLYGPGWADKNSSFKEPRDDYIKPLPPPGNLPADWARYKGLYLNGNQVILSYTVGASPVLESASLETIGDTKAFARTITLGPSAVAQSLIVADINSRDEKRTKEDVKDKTGKVTGTKEVSEFTWTPGTGKVENGIANVGAIHAAVVGAPPGAALEVTGNRITFKIPARNEAVTFKLLIANGGDTSKGAFESLAKASAKPSDLTALTKGGAPRWKDIIETKGTAGKPGEHDAYVIDKLTVPYKNSYESWMRTAAFDFFADGTRAAVSTWSGDVWIVSGIDENLEHLKWKRFATGLHQPLGLKIVNDEVYALCRDQITKLSDLNGDGEADFYQCFNNNWEMTTAFHAFAFDLQTDPEGNFYFAFGSPVKSGGPGFHKITKTNGTIMKVSKDGSKLDIYATGLRAPNGMGVGPQGQVTIGDNEGSWVPTSPLHWVKQGSFLGMSDAAHGAKVEQPKPLLWLPHNSDKEHPSMDNSCGGQVWVTSDKWGPYKGSLMHMSYGTSSLYLVMPQEVNGQMQGAAVKIPVNFTSSAMRARFNPKDGQLYVMGLKGWQTNASNDGGFDRVRYTGQTPHLPAAFKATKNGVYVTYALGLDQAYANDASNYSVEAWNYAWTSTYGSPEFKLEDGKKKGRDAFTVKSAKLQPDGKTVFLEMPDIKPCMQLRIKANVKASDGVDMKHDMYGTIYNLPE